MLDFKLAVLLLSVVDACPTTSVHATVGANVVLPVHIETKLNTSDLKVSWKLNNTVVHTYRDGRDYLENQNENFTNRTSMFEDEIAEGNFSLRLENVTKEDSGTYTCTVTNKNKVYYCVSLSVKLKESSVKIINETPNKNQSRRLIAGVIGGIVSIIVVIGVILGVFLYKRRSRNNRKNRNRRNYVLCMKDQNERVTIHHPNQGQPGADGKDEIELDKLNARQDQVQNDLDDQRCPTEAPGETDPLSDPPNRDAPLNESFQNPSQHV